MADSLKAWCGAIVERLLPLGRAVDELIQDDNFTWVDVLLHEGTKKRMQGILEISSDWKVNTKILNILQTDGAKEKVQPEVQYVEQHTHQFLSEPHFF